MHDKGLQDQLNSVEYLYLRDLSEPRDNSLQLIAEEAVVNASGVVSELTVMPELANILKGSSPIESVEGCRTFKLYWKRYVAYL